MILPLLALIARAWAMLHDRKEAYLESYRWSHSIHVGSGDYHDIYTLRIKVIRRNTFRTRSYYVNERVECTMFTNFVELFKHWDNLITNKTNIAR